MPSYTLNIIVQGHDRASGPLGAVQGALGGLAGVGQTMLGVFGGGLLLQGFNALTGAISSMTSEAFNAASNFQMMQIQMEGLIALQLAGQFNSLAEAQAAAVIPAAELSDWIADFAAKTPFTVQSLTEMTRGFLSIGMGVDPTKELTTALSSLGAGMGLTSWQLDRVVQNLLQTSRSSKITERDIREFGNAGIPVNFILDDMAKRLGITRDQALDLAKSGGEGVQEWTNSLISVANTSFPNALDNVSKTWAVAGSNIKDVIESIFGKEVLGPLLSEFAVMVSGGLDTIIGKREDFRKFGEQLAGVFEFLLPRAQWLMESLGNLANAILNALGIDLSQFNLKQFIDDLMFSFGNLLVQASVFVYWVTNNLQGALASGQTMFAPVLQGVMDLYTAFLTTLPQIQAFVDALIFGVTNAFNTFMPQISTNIGTALSAISVLWQQHGAQIMLVVAYTWNIITTTIGAGLTLVSGIISTVLQFISGDWQGAHDTMMATATTFMSGILALVGVSLDQFIADWSFILGATLALVVQWWNDTMTQVSTGLAAWGNLFGLWKEATLSFWAMIFKNLSDLISMWWLATTTIWSEGLKAIVNLVTGFASSVYDAGSAFVSGLWNGMKAKWDEMVAWLTEAADAVIAKFKDVWGIHSPSAVMAGLGRNLMAGMAQGIMAGESLPQLAFDSATRGMASGNGGGQDNRVTNNYYNLAVASLRSTESIANDFAVQRILAGA